MYTCGLPQSSLAGGLVGQRGGGLVGTQHVRRFQRVLQGLFEPGGLQGVVQADQAPRDEPRRHRCPQQGAHQVRGPLDPDHVRGGQQRRGSHRIRPVACGPPAHPGRGWRGRDMPAPARPAHHQVLRHPQRDRRDAGDLHAGGDLPRRTGQVTPAARARLWLQHPGLIRDRDSLQARSRVTLLPALATTRPRPPCLPLACLRFGRRTVLTRWLRRIRRIPACRPPQRRHLGLQRLDQRALLRHQRQQLRNPGSQLLIRRLLRMRHPSEPKHDHQPDASTDTPQISKGCDWLPASGEPCAASTARARSRHRPIFDFPAAFGPVTTVRPAPRLSSAGRPNDKNPLILIRRRNTRASSLVHPITASKRSHQPRRRTPPSQPATLPGSNQYQKIGRIAHLT